MKLTRKSPNYYETDDPGALATWLERGYGFNRQKQKPFDHATRLSHDRCTVIIRLDGNVELGGPNTASTIRMFEAVCAGDVEQVSFNVEPA